MKEAAFLCPICFASMVPAGTKRGKALGVEFRFRYCSDCHFRTVENPNVTQPASGPVAKCSPAPPSTEMYMRDVYWIFRRYHEWRGVLKAVGSLIPVGGETQWLDYGCGRGDLLKYVRKQVPCRPVGFDDSWFGERGLKSGAPMLSRDDLNAYKATFDVVTCIDVLQECRDPLSVLKDIRSFLKPGGLLFITTNNAAPFRSNFLKWADADPEMSVSFFEPETLGRALNAAGFRADFRGPLPGFSDIVRFKLTRDRGYRSLPVPAFPENVVPWRFVSWLADKRYKFSAIPIGWAI